MVPGSSQNSRSRLRRKNKLEALATRNIPTKVRAISIQGQDALIGLPLRMPCPKGYMKTFLVKLNACMSQQEVAKRIEKAFGDLDGDKKEI
jgi:polysaccharide deacetylase 2 family uncharacterized protein YibQ